MRRPGPRWPSRARPSMTSPPPRPPPGCGSGPIRPPTRGPASAARSATTPAAPRRRRTAGAAPNGWGRVGRAADNVVSLDVLTGSGERLAARRAGRGGLAATGPIGAGLDALVAARLALIRTEVSLVPSPKAVALAVLGYASMPAAADMVLGLLPHRPVAIEGIDARLVDVFRARRGAGTIPELPRGGGGAVGE